MKNLLYFLIIMMFCLCSCATYLVEDLELKNEKVDIILSYINYSYDNYTKSPDSNHVVMTAKIRIVNRSQEIIEFKYNEIYLSDGLKKVKMNQLTFYNTFAKYLPDNKEVITLEPGESSFASFKGDFRYVNFIVEKAFKPNKIIFDIYGELNFTLNEKK